MVGKITNPPTKATAGDYAHSAFKTGVGVVPVFGGALSEAFALAVSTPAEKRMENWRKLLSETLNALVEQIEGITPESLSQNPVFTSAVELATRTAMTTERAQKLQILQNVVFNVGRGEMLDELLRSTFYAIVDRYLPEHILLLGRLNDSKALSDGFQEIRQSSPHLISGANSDEECITIESLPHFLLTETDETVTKELFRDLHRDGLCHGSEGIAHTLDLNGVEYLGHGNYTITLRGQAFLRFVSPSDASRAHQR